MSGRPPRPGPIAVHGGGEFLPGDEAFLRALLEAARSSTAARPAAEARARSGGGSDIGGGSGAGGGSDIAAIRIVIVPTAAARQRPELAAAHGRRTFLGVAAVEPRIDVDVTVAMVVDRGSAEAPAVAERLAGADLVYLPGGDPDLIPRLLPGSRALRSILAARERGAVVAGASAGAMAMAPWTWTPAGGRVGLGLVTGLVVVPHFDGDEERTRRRLAAAGLPDGLGLLGLSERTGVVSVPGPDDGRSREWRVHGPGLVHWHPAGAGTPIVAMSGQTIALPG